MLPILQQIMELVEKYNNKKNQALPKDILGLVLTPTRELAMQIVEHSRAILGRRTPIRVVPLIGGMAVQKQERLLTRGAHILVATTGRLWEFLTEAHSVALNFGHLRFLVLDEADKMIEPGRFRELSQVLRIIYTAKKIDMGLLSETEGFEQPLPEETKAMLEEGDEDPNDHLPPKPIQTFVFSATMALSEAARRDLRKINSAKKEAAKKNSKKGSKHQRNSAPDAPPTQPKDFTDSTGILDKLMERIQFQREIELVDLTTAKIVAANIEEAKIQCLPEEKDLYLYYFLQKYKGRTLVFVNSISNIKRIVPLLAFLKVPAWPMHAAMQQRQRLKNLERFKKTEFWYVLASSRAQQYSDFDSPCANCFVAAFSSPRTLWLVV
jgi:ATP-dependent RNA helicase DDX24/MAK5